MNAATYSVPPDFTARRTPAMIAGVVGLAACALGFVLDRPDFFRAYLVAYLFWLGIALGSMALMMVHHMSGGAWGIVIRRIFEASSRTLPALAVLFLPIILGMRDLFPWTHADLVANDHALQAKAPYLNTTFFLIRAAIYFGCWIGISGLLNKWSLQQDQDDPAEPTRRMQLLSSVGLVIYALTIMFASIDWVMSLNPHWFSTIYGFLFMGGQGLAALAFTVVIAALLSRRAPMADVYKAGHFHDLGKLMLAFVMLWAYFNFSQYLIIYSGNLAEEIPYYIARTTNGWQYVALALVIFHFALPFSLLLSRDLKRNASRLIVVAVGVLFMRVLDLFFLISPEFGVDGVSLHMTASEAVHSTRLFGHWLDVAAPIGIGGIWLWLFLTQLGQRPLLPIQDPQLAEALEGAGGH